jgi:hypothetical protein
VTICRLSGLLATTACPTAVEWFAPGTEPSGRCDWHTAAGVTLPAEYAEWAAQREGPAPAPARSPSRVASRADDRFEIVSPQDGDRYRIPPGAEARYATVALRAAGRGEDRVRWYVDGIAFTRVRWTLRSGVHRFRAVSASGDSAEVSVTVE